MKKARDSWKQRAAARALTLVLILPALATTGCARSSPGGDNVASRSRTSIREAERSYVHTVAKGDTLSRLKQIYGVPSDMIADANALPRDAKLRVGQSLVIPGSLRLLAARKVAAEAGARDEGRFREEDPRFPWPVAGPLVARFGQGEGGRGIRISAKKGAEVRSVAQGEVVFAGPMKGYGHLLILDHHDGIYSIYGGSVALLLKKGQTVKARRPVARVTGPASGTPTVYFEIRKAPDTGGEPIARDPLPLLQGSGS